MIDLHEKVVSFRACLSLTSRDLWYRRKAPARQHIEAKNNAVLETASILDFLEAGRQMVLSSRPLRSRRGSHSLYSRYLPLSTESTSSWINGA